MTTLDAIFDAVARAAADVPAELPRLHTAGTAADRNPTGDEQSAADRWLDERFRQEITSLDAIGAYASEEHADVLDCGDGYGIAIDPLDGSSNLAANGPIGTILGVYDPDASLPARGTDLVGSAIVVFGPTISMTVATDDTATRYRIADGERIESRSVSIANDTTESTVDASTDEIIAVSGCQSVRSEQLRTRLGELYADRVCRYNGAAVADVQSLLERGGVCCYPRTATWPDGVLRLQYEANPIAHLVEAAGGEAIDYRGRIRDREPESLHERVPVIVGSSEPIERLRSALAARQ